MRDTAYGATHKPGLVPLVLAVLPAMAVVTTGVGSLLMGGSVLLTMAGSSLMLSAVWRYVRQEHRVYAYILFSATVASMMQMIASVAFPAVTKTLGLYLPLVPFSCALTTCWEASDQDHELEDSLVRAVRNGATYLLTLMVAGCIREILGVGSIFGFSLGDRFSPMYLIATAPGGFILAGVLLAIIRALLPGGMKGGDAA